MLVDIHGAFPGQFDCLVRAVERIASKLEEAAPSASNNSDYAAALRAYTEYCYTLEPDTFGGLSFINWCRERLHSSTNVAQWRALHKINRAGVL